MKFLEEVNLKDEEEQLGLKKKGKRLQVLINKKEKLENKIQKGYKINKDLLDKRGMGQARKNQKFEESILEIQREIESKKKEKEKNIQTEDVSINSKFKEIRITDFIGNRPVITMRASSHKYALEDL